jgi:hypothetical protein
VSKSVVDIVIASSLSTRLSAAAAAIALILSPALSNVSVELPRCNSKLATDARDVVEVLSYPSVYCACD